MEGARVKVRCSIRCTGRIALQLDLGSISDVKAGARLHFRVEMRPE